MFEHFEGNKGRVKVLLKSYLYDGFLIKITWYINQRHVLKIKTYCRRLSFQHLKTDETELIVCRQEYLRKEPNSQSHYLDSMKLVSCYNIKNLDFFFFIRFSSLSSISSSFQQIFFFQLNPLI